MCRLDIPSLDSADGGSRRCGSRGAVPQPGDPMPISGLVLTLSSAESEARRAVSWLESDSRFAVGEPAPDQPRRLPVTLETADEPSNRACWKELQEHSGVEFVDVVCVFFA